MLNNFKKIFIGLFLLCFSGSLFALTDVENVLWDDYIVLRDTMYNCEKNAEGLIPLYETAKKSANELFKEDTLLVALSRCEYIMGRAYSYEENKEKAGEYYDAGEEYAAQALEIKETTTAQLMYAENISQNCSVKPTSYAISKGTKVGALGLAILEVKPSSAAAKYLRAAQYIYAPAPFHNYKKGIRVMQEILNDPNNTFEKDDIFNITSSIGYGFMERKVYDEAAVWYKKALELYPNNSYVNGLLKDVEANL